MSNLTFPEIMSHFSPKVQRRFQNVCVTHRSHMFFTHEGTVYAVRDGDFVICTFESEMDVNTLNGNQSGKRLEDNKMVKKIQPVRSIHKGIFVIREPEESRVKVHAVDRLLERMPVFRNKPREAAEEYILKAVQSGLAAGDFFECDDRAVHVLYKQLAFVVKRDREHAIVTTIRRNKLHNYALELFKAKPTRPIPTFLVSKQAKDALL